MNCVLLEREPNVGTGVAGCKSLVDVDLTLFKPCMGDRLSGEMPRPQPGK